MFRIIVLGARGSFPVAGSSFAKYGGKTTAILVEAGDQAVLIDAGSGLMCNESRFSNKQHVHMVFTHYHLDHILSFPFFPYHLRADQRVTVHHDPKLGTHPRDALLDFVRKPFLPMDHASLLRPLAWSAFDATLEIGPLRIDAFPTHHPEFGIGYRFTVGDKVYVHISDHEHEPHFDGPILEQLADADLVTMDAMYEPQDFHKGFGHSTWPTVVELARKASVKKLLLWHHHYHYTDSRIDRIVDDARGILPATEAAQEGRIYVP